MTKGPGPVKSEFNAFKLANVWNDNAGMIGQLTLEKLAAETAERQGWPKPDKSGQIVRMLSYAAANMPDDWGIPEDGEAQDDTDAPVTAGSTA